VIWGAPADMRFKVSAIAVRVRHRPGRVPRFPSRLPQAMGGEAPEEQRVGG